MNIPEMDQAVYNRAIKEDKETCVIVFTKESCNVCKKLEPVVDRVAEEYKAEGKPVTFYHMDVLQPDARKIFKSWDLVGVPQSVFIREGEFVDALPGALNGAVLKKEIDSLINPKQSFLERVKGIFG
ncbi:thioredoxin family protein [Peptococcus simiae]|uniref:Thioredoxin family protein n=1 Tax=Peptococcus simiae TaxID=1643805 RepID=A0ABW9H0K7_9FIRM